MLIQMWATCYPNNCFCESLHAGAIFQPVNMFSSLAFVVAGIFIAFRYKNSWGYIYALLLAIIGIGSAYYHARLGFIGQTIDVAGMYLLVTFVLFAVFERTRKYFLAYFLAGNAVLISILISVPTLRRYVFAVLVLVLVVTFWKQNLLNKYFWASLLIMVIATAIWTLDIMSIWCWPDSYLQGHAIWHVLGAVSAVLLFKSIQPILLKEKI